MFYVLKFRGIFRKSCGRSIKALSFVFDPSYSTRRERQVVVASNYSGSRELSRNVHNDGFSASRRNHLGICIRDLPFYQCCFCHIVGKSKSTFRSFLEGSVRLFRREIASFLFGSEIKFVNIYDTFH